jgi:hypothetical protein
VVRAALAKAVHGIAAIDGRLVDCDAWERDRLRDAETVVQQTVTEEASVRTPVTEPVTEPLSNAERQRRWRERQRQTE